MLVFFIYKSPVGIVFLIKLVVVNNKHVFSEREIMEQKLIGCLQFEQQLLQEMLRLADRQQTALVNYRLSELSEIISFQDALISNMRKAEEKRISLLMEWLNITRKEATSLKLSTLEEKVGENNVSADMKRMRGEIKTMIDRLHTLNSTNRLLTNRARVNVKEMIDFITGGKTFCNVQA